MTNNPTIALGNSVILTAEKAHCPTTFFIHGQMPKEMPFSYRQRSDVASGHPKKGRLDAISEGVNDECFAMGSCFAMSSEPDC